MKKFLNKFLSSPISSSQDTHDDGSSKGDGNKRIGVKDRKKTLSDLDSSKLKEQLSKKVRGSSAIPNSFYDRDIQFKCNRVSDVSEGHGRKRSVAPRKEGFMHLKQGRFSSWIRVYCLLRKGKMVLYLVPPSTVSYDTIDTSSIQQIIKEEDPIRTVQLVGAHLESCSNGEQECNEFLIRESDGSHQSTIFIRCDTSEEREQWFVGLSQVPGIFRRVADYYTLGPLWGQGATCKVHECYSKFTGATYALKSRIHSTRESTQAMHNELRILQLCAKNPHPSIPRLVDFFFDTNGTIEIVTDLMRGGELFDDVKGTSGMSEDRARIVFEQIAAGLAHLHSLGIGHRDIKPENIMYINSRSHLETNLSDAEICKKDPDIFRIKIMDYDLAKVNYCPEWVAGTPCGTARYMAPEIVRGEQYSLAVDDWSLGVCLYVMLSGKVPFGGSSTEDIDQAILNGTFRLEGPHWDSICWEAKDLIKKLLVSDPSKRLTATSSLSHPFVALKEQGIAIPGGVNRRSSLSDMPLEKIDESLSLGRGSTLLQDSFADLGMDSEVIHIDDGDDV